MPSARTHDTITVLLAVPAFAVTYLFTKNAGTSALVCGAFLFGGLMFGPDLDTVSRQYSRWSVLKGLWFPYRTFFKHRSRFTHGLIFGAFLRVFYFCGVVTLIAFGAAYIYAAYSGGKAPGIGDISAVWRPIADAIDRTFGANFYVMAFIGIWLGAASHTFTDMAGSFIKTGRIAKFL